METKSGNCRRLYLFACIVCCRRPCETFSSTLLHSRRRFDWRFATQSYGLLSKMTAKGSSSSPDLAS
jgi:hypothetical protein